MKLHQINIDDVNCAVHTNHNWSPADCVFVIGTGKDNKACFAVGQISAVLAVVERCADWIEKNGRMQAELPAYGERNPKG